MESEAGILQQRVQPLPLCRCRIQPRERIGGKEQEGIEPQRDRPLRAFAQATGLHMGQWLCVPMILGGLYLMNSAKARRVRVEPIAGSDSVS